jgi:hypothetical protein
METKGLVPYVVFECLNKVRMSECHVCVRTFISDILCIYSL